MQLTNESSLVKCSLLMKSVLHYVSIAFMMYHCDHEHPKLGRKLLKHAFPNISRIWLNS